MEEFINIHSKILNYLRLLFLEKLPKCQELLIYIIDFFIRLILLNFAKIKKDYLILIEF